MKSRALSVYLMCFICLIAFLLVCADTLQSDGADDDEGTMHTMLLGDSSKSSDSKGSYDFSYESLKSVVVRIVQAAAELAESHEEHVGKTVNIDSEIKVDASTGPYRIDSGNVYEFSSNGSLTIKEDGVLILGTSFLIGGHSATINMEKGSSLMFMGSRISMVSDIKIVLDGSLKVDMDLIGDIVALNVDTKLKGEIDLEGSLKIGLYTMTGKEGSEIVLDMEVIASIDSGSAIKNIKDITELVFSEDNGLIFDIKLNDLKIDLGGMMFKVTASGRGSEIRAESPLGENSFVITNATIPYLTFDVDFIMGLMSTIHLMVSDLMTVGEDGRTVFEVWGLEYKIESLSETYKDIRLSVTTIGLDIGDRTVLTLYSGDMYAVSGSLKVDLNVLEDGYYYTGSTNYYGRLNVPDPSCITGMLDAPYSSDTHLVIGDVVDIRFAGDEEAYLEIMPDLDFYATIHPYDGYKLLEIESDRYVEYVIDDTFPYAYPKSLKGLYHVELGEREYCLYLDYELYAEVPATTVVQLPTPAPIPGMVFVGWNDEIFTYRTEYEMPVYDVLMKSVWTGSDYKLTIGDDYCKITSKYDSVVIREDMMGWIRAYFERVSASYLRIETTSILIDIDANTIMKTEGALTLVLNTCLSGMIPEYEQSVYPGLLYIVEMCDDNGIVKTDTCTVTMTVTYDYLSDDANIVRMYSMDDLGRLTELVGTYEIFEATETEDAYATVTFTTNSLPYCVVKSFYEQDVGAARIMLIISLLPILIVGLVLAFITRRRG